MRSPRLFIGSLAGIVLLVGLLSGCNTELTRARDLLQRQDYLFAAIFYEKALKRDPDNEDALKEIAELYCGQLNRVDKCFEKSEMLYRLYKNDPKIKGWYQKSLLTVAKGMFLEQRLRKASEYLLKYRKIDPTNGPVIFMLGNARFRLYSKPPLSDNDKRNLQESIKYLEEAIKNSKPETEVSSSYDGSKKNRLQWEAYMLIGRVYELYILEHFKVWKKEVDEKMEAARKKAEEDAKKNPKKKKGKSKEEKEPEEPKFPVNMEHFNKAKDAYEAASKIQQPNQYKRFLPKFRIGMMYANMLKENEKAEVYLSDCEKLDPNNASIIGNLKMIYDRLKEAAEKAKDKAKVKEYGEKAEQYDSKIASLRALK